MNNADLVLTTAAEQIRYRAEGATPGPWEEWSMTESFEPNSRIYNAVGPVENESDLICIAEQSPQSSNNMHYISSLPPEVMMLLAVWLEEEAKTIPPEADTSKWGPIEEAPAVAFALKYLEGITIYEEL